MLFKMIVDKIEGRKITVVAQERKEKKSYLKVRFTVPENKKIKVGDKCLFRLADNKIIFPASFKV